MKLITKPPHRDVDNSPRSAPRPPNTGLLHIQGVFTFFPQLRTTPPTPAADMRPRSRLLSKRSLPTISEGQEGQVQELNQINSLHALRPTHSEAPSPKDYLQSICQLARPAFSPRGSSHARTLSLLDPLGPGQRLPQIPPLTRPPTPTIHRATRVAEEDRKEVGVVTFSDISAQMEEACPGPDEGFVGDYRYRSTTDPLEYLYGCRGSLAPSGGRESGEGGATEEHCLLSRAHGWPHVLSQRHASYRLHMETPHSPTPAPVQRHPPTVSDSSRLVSWNSHNSATAGGRLKCMDRRSMVSHWIADCRQAWREARVRACMLPVIAEI
ncbi:hypothetical protein MATL_G00050710 [Megalops atlanticus]|uniref:Uncharacterized protein n=1 Tax=Megalops atlanticus TaxID=7932 RepID=A0A9D3QBM8_MEGAT|nr:hypothetical protein MATL_G00050710 [Megalops atlanticus]